MDNENIAIEEVAKIVKSKNPEEANIINSILNMKPKNVTPGQEVLAAKLILLIFETLNNLRINYLGETGEYYTRRLVASHFAIENLNKIGEITKKAIDMETNALASLDPKSNAYALTKQLYGQFHFKMYPYVTILKQILIYNFEEHVKTNTILLMLADIFGIPKSEFVSDEDLPEAEIVEEGDETNPMKGGSKFEFLKKNLENIDFQEAIKKYKQFVLLYNCQNADIISFNMMLLMNKALLKPITKGGAKDGEEGAGAEEVFNDSGARDLDSIQKEPTTTTTTTTTTDITTSSPRTAIDFTQQSNVPKTFKVDGQEYTFPLALSTSPPSLELTRQIADSEKAFMNVVTNLPPDQWKTLREEEKVQLLANLSHMTSSQVESFTAGVSRQLSMLEIGNFDFSNFQISVNTLLPAFAGRSNYRVLQSFDRNIEREVDVETTITERDEAGNRILNEDGTPKTRRETSKKTVSSPMSQKDIDNQVKQLSDTFDIDVLQEIATSGHETFINTCKRIGVKYADTTGGLSQLKQITETLSHLDTELTNLEELQITATELGEQLGVDGVDPETWVPGTNELGRRYFQWLGYGSEQQALLDRKIDTEQKLTKSSEDFIDDFTKLLTGSDDKGSSMTEYSGESGQMTETTYSPYKFDQDAKALVSSLNQHYCETLIPEANYHLTSTINKEVDEDGNEKEIVEIGVKFSYEPLNIDGQNIVQKTVYSRAFLIQRLNTMIAAAKEKKEGMAIFQKPEWKARLDDYTKKRGTISEVIKPLLDNSETGSLDYIISSASTLVELLQFSPGFKVLKGVKTPEVVQQLTLQDMLKINAQLENYQNAFKSQDPAKFLKDKQELADEIAEEKVRSNKAKEQSKIAAAKRTEYIEEARKKVYEATDAVYLTAKDGVTGVLGDVKMGAISTIEGLGEVGVTAAQGVGGILREGGNQGRGFIRDMIYSPEGVIVLILIILVLCVAGGIHPKQMIITVFGLLGSIAAAPVHVVKKTYGVSQTLYNMLKGDTTPISGPGDNIGAPATTGATTGATNGDTTGATNGATNGATTGATTHDNGMPDLELVSNLREESEESEPEPELVPTPVTEGPNNIETTAATASASATVAPLVRKAAGDESKQTYMSVVNTDGKKTSKNYNNVMNKLLDNRDANKKTLKKTDIIKDLQGLEEKFDTTIRDDTRSIEDLVKDSNYTVQKAVNDIQSLLKKLRDNGIDEVKEATKMQTGGLLKKNGSKKKKVEKKKGRKTKRKTYTKKKKGNSKKHKKNTKVKRTTRRK